jgi:hypothetical protein
MLITRGRLSTRSQKVMNCCVHALDEYLMQIRVPPYKECGNVGAYFSDHYCTYGDNVQAICNADCRCPCHFASFCDPGRNNDEIVIHKTSRFALA